MNKKKRLAAGIILIAAAAALVCFFIFHYRDSRKTLHAYDEVQKSAHEDISGEDQPDYLGLSIDFKTLKSENPDTVGWILIPGTAVDYPIMQSAENEEEDYYLTHNFDRSTGYPSCIYMQKTNASNFSDAVTILYGHNMKNGTMFASLHSYEDSDFFSRYPDIYVYTENATYHYHVIASYETKDDYLPSDYDSFDSPADVLKYQKWLLAQGKKSGCVDGSVSSLSVTDKILTLSTCVSGKSDRRFLVQAQMTELIAR